MNYIFQRIVQNDFQWTRPSPGRLGSNGEGRYLQENGFGHEDWNFNPALSIKGNLYGYVYYNPSEKKQNETFNIAFASYTNRAWYVVGFYLNSNYVNNPPIDESVLQQKSFDILQLGKSLGNTWRKKNQAQIMKILKAEAEYLHWKVKSTDIIRLPQPVEIPKSLFNSKNYRIVRPTDLNKKKFDQIYKYAISNSNKEDKGEEYEFPEGQEKERLHKFKERNPTVIAIAKRNFLSKHGKLFCQVCNFDFEEKYGELGAGFIEAHHTLPLSQLTDKSKTKPSDIAMVCSNCHRMLHTNRPWLIMSKLKKLIK